MAADAHPVPPTWACMYLQETHLPCSEEADGGVQSTMSITGVALSKLRV